MIAVESRPSDQKLYSLLVAAFILATQMLLFLIAYRTMPPGAIDLRAFYAAGVILRSGQAHQLYNDAYEAKVQLTASGPLGASLPFLYPPFAALLFVPLTAVSYTTAITVFEFVNLLLAGACAYLLAGTARLPRGGAWLVWALVVGFNPVCFTLLQGQVSLVLLLAVCAGERALERDRPFAAGILLALTLIKFQLALPMALLFLLWRRWRVVEGFLTGAAVLLALSAWLVGGRGLAAYCTSVGGLEHRVAAGVVNYSIFLTKMPNLYGLACFALGNRPAAVVVTAIASLAMLAWAAARRPSLSVAVIVALLVSYHMLPYDLSLLLLPLAIAARTWLHARRDPASRTPQQRFRSHVEAAVAALLLLPPMYLILESKAVMPLLVLPMLLLLVLLAMPRAEAVRQMNLACPDMSTA